MSGPCIGDTTTVVLTSTGAGLRATPNISADLDNALECRSGGIYAPSHGNMPAVLGLLNGTSITAGAPPLMTFASAAYDPRGMLDVTNNRINILVAGYYRVHAQLVWVGSAGGTYRYLEGVKNGNRAGPYQGHTAPAIAAAGSVSGRSLMRLAIGDYLQLGVWDDFAGAIDYTGSKMGVWMERTL